MRARSSKFHDKRIFVIMFFFSPRMFKESFVSKQQSKKEKVKREENCH